MSLFGIPVSSILSRIAGAQVSQETGRTDNRVITTYEREGGGKVVHADMRPTAGGHAGTLSTISLYNREGGLDRELLVSHARGDEGFVKWDDQWVAEPGGDRKIYIVEQDREGDGKVEARSLQEWKRWNPGPRAVEVDPDGDGRFEAKYTTGPTGLAELKRLAAEWGRRE